MPIVIENDVDPVLTGALSYVTGRTQYQQRQAEQERELYNQQQRQMLDLLGQRNREVAQERQVRDRLANPTPAGNRASAVPRASRGGSADGDLIRAASAQQANLNNIVGQLANRALAGRQQQAHDQMSLGAQLYNSDQNRMADLQEQQFGWGNDSAEYLETQVKDITAAMAKQQQKLTPQGRQMYGELAGKLRAIQKMRGQARPADYSNLLGQWLEEFEASGVQDHIEEPPTVEQYMGENAYDLGTGYTMVRQPDGKIQAFKTEEPAPTQAEIEKEKEARQFEREKHLLDINKIRITAYADWMKAMPKPQEFMKKIPGTFDKEGNELTPASQVPDDQTFQKVMRYWLGMDPTNFGFGEEQGLPQALQGEPAPGDPLPASQPMTPEITGPVADLEQQTQPIEVTTPDDLRQKIMTGQIPIGGKYIVNGVPFTRTR